MSGPSEQIAQFGAGLVGVTTIPDQEPTGGVLFLNAGLLPRIGPNRLHVTLARRFALRGLVGLRFDFAGVGDSAPRRDGMPFHEHSVADTQAAMEWMATRYRLDRFTIVGLCVGGDVALQVASRDERVAGLVLVNAGDLSLRQEGQPAFDAARDQQLLEYVNARTQMRYYVTRMFDPRSWRRVVSGKSNLGAIRSAVQRVVRRPQKIASPSGIPRTDLARLTERGVRTLMIYSDGSTAWDLFRVGYEAEVSPLARQGPLRVEVVKNTDHVFTLIQAQRSLVETIDGWLAGGATG